MTTKILFFLGFLISFSFNVQSQCTPVMNCSDTLFCPKSLSPAYVNAPYNETITVKFPTNFTYGGYVNAQIDSVMIDSVGNKPKTFSYQLNPAKRFIGGQLGCMQISGTPVKKDTSIHSITIYFKLYGKISGISQMLPSSYDFNISILDTTHNLGIRPADTYSFNVSTNSPNPFVTKTEINVSSTVNDLIDFSVYNMVGKLIKNEQYRINPGSNKIIFEAKNLPSGIYFYQISNGKQSATHRMIITTN